jgi:hypothetical protein
MTGRRIGIAGRVLENGREDGIESARPTVRVAAHAAVRDGAERSAQGGAVQGGALCPSAAAQDPVAL